MDKKNLIKRIFTCVVFPPVIFAIIYFLNFYYNLIPAICIFIVALIASKEMQEILFTKNEKPLLPYFIPPFLVFVDWVGIILKRNYIAFFALFFLTTLVFFIEIVVGENDEEPYAKSIDRISKSLLLIFYPNAFMMYWLEILNIHHNGNMIGNLIFIFMLILVFSNDIFCYVFGMAFGKNNRGIIKASPKKSLVGFLAGFLLTPAVGFAYISIFKSVGVFFEGPIVVIILSFIIALCSDVGDLIESIFKRSGHIKDSGNIIPGRGGILDSIDSIITSSAFFQFFLTIILEHLS